MKYPLYNDELCPAFWDKKGDEYTMKEDVRETLMTIAEDFIGEYLKEAKLKMTIEDVILIGSGTNFNWTPFSDLDLHILVDYNELGIGKEYAEILLTAIKINWNKEHNITIKGHDIEIYVQGVDQDVESVSVYSVKDGEWIEEPQKEKIKFDKKSIKQKHTKLKKEIDTMLENADEPKIMKMLEKLYKFRQFGLDSKMGEFSAENIVFKILRAQGYLEKMKKYSAQIYDNEMTLQECRKKAKEICGFLREGVERSLRQGITPAMGARRWSLPYGKIPDTNPLEELAYKGNAGVMEIVKFYNEATIAQIALFDKLAEIPTPEAAKEAWLLVQSVSGVKLQGEEEFGTEQDVSNYKRTMITEIWKIDDGIKLVNDKLAVVSDKEDNFVPVDDERKMRVHKFSVDGVRLQIFGAYNISMRYTKAAKNSSEWNREGQPTIPEYLTNLRHAVKNPDDASSKKIINDLIDISLERMSKQMKIDDVNVIIPLGSKSNLNDIISKKLLKYIPKAQILTKFVNKSKWKDVRLSRAWQHEKELEDLDGVKRVGVHRAEDVLMKNQRSRPEQTFEVKQVPRGLRRYFSSFYETDKGQKIDLSNSKIMFVDDTLEEGATLAEAIRATSNLKPREITGYVFLFGRGT
jgi:predicted nucleotidyltransferase